MKKLFLALVVVLVCGAPALADPLDDFLNDLDFQAGADPQGYSVQLGTHFDAPQMQVNSVLGSVGRLADAFLVFELGRMTGLPVEQVLGEYQNSHGQGWGVMAKNLGIKPGSPEFHQLKNGDFNFSMHGAGSGNQGQGQGQGKNKSKHGKKEK